MTEPKPLLAAGYHLAKIVAYGWKLTKAQDLAPTIKFKTESGEIVYWQGSLNGAGRAISVKALVTCGLRNTARLADFALGPPSELLDMEKPVSLTVEHEEYNGKTYAKVRWINDADGGGLKDTIEPERAAQFLVGLDLEADFEAEIGSREHNPMMQGSQKRAQRPSSGAQYDGRFDGVPDDVPF